MMLVLAAEVLLNLVLDFYRPRSADEEVRPAFDSRLLGLFTEPGGIAKSMADAINYQFGFEVSSTWFYKLLQRSVVPLIGFALLTLIFASSMVFVRADEQMVIERFGRPLRTADGEVRVFDSGLHVKLPWPVDKAWRVATHRIHELRVGQFEIEASEDDQDLLLWTTKHAREPHVKVLVATPQLVQFMPEEAMDDVAQTGPYDIQSADDARTLTEAVPVSQLRVAVTIQYEIRHPYEWLRTYKSPEGQGPKTVLEMLAKREILKAVAHMEAIELLGPDRGGLESQLWEKIQAQADQRQLGIDIIFLGVQGVHPPTETAEAFQDVIGAESVKMATIRAARADRNRRLAEAAGDVGRAIELARAISRLNQLEAMDNPPEAELNETRARLQRLFFGQEEAGLRPVGGKAAEVLAGARAERWRLVNAAQGNALKFVEEIVLKQAAPNLYRMRHYLIALSEATSKVRKYVIALDEGSQRANTFHLNLQDPRNVPLDVVMDEEQE
jgi:regulator of protease activity HflC (stomatin/prohibitin superfamily)